MMNQLQIFNNEEFGEVRVIGDIENPLFNLEDVSFALGYITIAKGNEYLHKARIGKILENGNISTVVHDAKHYIDEDGLYDFILESRTEKARGFRKWVTSEVLPTLRKTGKLDIIEQKLQLIPDETERELSLGLYALEQALKVNPHDVTLSIMCDNKRLALESYKQSIKLNSLENKTNQIEEKLDKMTVVGDRVEFKREVDSICRATGRNQSEVFGMVYNRFKDVYGVDVNTRVKNRRNELQMQRDKDNKKPYAESTLKQKVNALDIVAEIDMWKEISKCLGNIRLELLDVSEVN